MEVIRRPTRRPEDAGKRARLGPLSLTQNQHKPALSERSTREQHGQNGIARHETAQHFSHTWLKRGGAEGDLMELNGWVSPQMLTRYGASARGARARRSYDRVMNGLC